MQPLENINWDKVKEATMDYMSAVEKGGYVDEDLVEWILEAALEAVYGKEVFEKIREVNKNA